MVCAFCQHSDYCIHYGCAFGTGLHPFPCDKEQASAGTPNELPADAMRAEGVSAAQVDLEIAA